MHPAPAPPLEEPTGAGNASVGGSISGRYGNDVCESPGTIGQFSGVGIFENSITMEKYDVEIFLIAFSPP
jgi:hypothetical protein